MKRSALVANKGRLALQTLDSLLVVNYLLYTAPHTHAPTENLQSATECVTTVPVA